MTTPGTGSGELEVEARASSQSPSSRAKEAPWHRFLEQLALSPFTPVLIVGQGGVGAARRLHRMTYPRGRPPFVHVDCTWLPERDASRLLFGLESPSKVERGFIERANGGTLFLDDIEKLPPVEQGRVAEFLDSMRFRRQLGQRDVEVKLRIVAGLTGSEQQAVGTGRLRRDLHARLSVLPVAFR